MSNLRKKRQRRSLLDSDEEEDVNPLADKTRPSNQEKCNEVEGLPHNCEFLSNLKIAGLILETSRDIERPHKLQCEQALFQKKLEKCLDGGSNFDLFVDQCQKYLESSNEVLLKALMPVRASPDSCQDPESLMRIFLNVECLQPAFSSFLLEKLAILSLEFEDQRTVCIKAT